MVILRAAPKVLVHRIDLSPSQPSEEMAAQPRPFLVERWERQANEVGKKERRKVFSEEYDSDEADAMESGDSRGSQFSTRSYPRRHRRRQRSRKKDVSCNDTR